MLSDMEMKKMDMSAIINASSGISLAQTQDAASTLVLKSALNFEKESGEETVQMMNTIPPSDHMLDMKV